MVGLYLEPAGILYGLRAPSPKLPKGAEANIGDLEPVSRKRKLSLLFTENEARQC